MDTIQDKIAGWVFTGETGISSMAMAAALLGKDPNKEHRYNTPSDPDDFNRCLKLLRCVPEARDQMDKIAAISDAWKRLVDRWEEVETCFLDEVGIDWEKAPHLHASKTYSLMKSIERGELAPPSKPE